MSSRSRTEVIPASGVIDLGPANFFFLLDTGGAVNVTFFHKGTNYGAENILAGYMKQSVEGWRSAKIAGVVGTSVTYFYGDEDVREDSTDYRRTVGVFQASQPSTLATAADVNVGGSAVAIQLLPANAARKRATCKLNDGATVNIRIGDQANVAAGRGMQLQNGQAISLEPTAAIYAMRESAGTAVVSLIEENY